VDKSRRARNILRTINSTFIAFIRNKYIPETFDDFRPISLCNAVYKIISEISAGRFNSILYPVISGEQYVYIDGIQIHEARGIAQEDLHTIKVKKKIYFYH